MTTIKIGTTKVIITPLLLLRVVLTFILLPLALLLVAGRLDWWQAWLYITVSIVLSVISRIMMARKNPDLVTERASFIKAEGVKSWDRMLVPVIAIYGPLVLYIIAGLDKRFGWSPPLPVIAEMIGFAVILLGYLLGTWAMVNNRFFSSVVRIQVDRGHQVVRTGPYRFIRHPAYAGGILAWLATPILLGTLWALLPATLISAGIAIRTALEDRTLHSELSGYQEYSRQTRFRLVPGVW
jgi:protein-S-isoprenylcysteine O-methyltransferase Ste14